MLQVQRTASNAARRVTGMDVIAHTQALADREMEPQAQRNAIMFHVKPDVNGATDQISKSQPGPRRTGPSPIQYAVVCR